MDAVVRAWTRIERPPAGFEPGRVVVLVDGADGVRRYALWDGGDPPLDGRVALEQRGSTWVARPAPSPSTATTVS